MSKRYSTEIFQPGFSDLVKKELDPRFSRKAIELAPSQSPLPFGLVLGMNDKGLYAPYAAAGAQQAGEGQDGQSASAGQLAILLSPLPASESQQTGLALTGFAVINKNALVFDAGVKDRDEVLTKLAGQNFVIEAIAAGEEGDAA